MKAKEACFMPSKSLVEQRDCKLGKSLDYGLFFLMCSCLDKRKTNKKKNDMKQHSNGVMMLLLQVPKEVMWFPTNKWYKQSRLEKPKWLKCGGGSLSCWLPR